MIHSNDSANLYKPELGERKVICAWKDGETEAYVIKFPPQGKSPTTFQIIGRLSLKAPFRSFKGEFTSFMDCEKAYKGFVKQLIAVQKKVKA